MSRTYVSPNKYLSKVDSNPLIFKDLLSHMYQRSTALSRLQCCWRQREHSISAVRDSTNVNFMLSL